jgi:O-antigen/teichoic acid export membrane protein
LDTIRRSVLFSISDRYLSQVLLVLTTAVMARILTPAETGLFVIANSLILLADNFREWGIGAFIVQERHLTRPVVQSAFTVTLLLSVAMGGAVYLGAGEIAAFYGSPALKDLLILSIIGILIIPFGSSVLALLQRDLEFKKIAIINIVGALANCIATISFGLAGIGAASFIWGYVISKGLVTVLAIVVRPDWWVFRPSLRHVRTAFSFGSISAVVTVVNMAFDLLPRLALGKILGFDAVGIFSRAVTVCQLPERALISALQPVVLPAMAAHARAGGDLKEAYLRGHELMSAIQWPALIMLALLADPVVQVLLGSQWGAVPPLVRIIALATMALAPAFMTYPVLVAVGRVKDTMFASLISLPPSILLVVMAAFHGTEAVAASLLLTAPLQMYVALFFIRRALNLTWAELARASKCSIVLALGTAVIPAAIVALSPSGFDLDWLYTALALLGGVVGWFTSLRLVHHPIGEEIIGMWHTVWRFPVWHHLRRGAT